MALTRSRILPADTSDPNLSRNLTSVTFSPFDDLSSELLLQPAVECSSLPPDIVGNASAPRSERASAAAHRCAIRRMRPLPWQYIYSFWHMRGTTPPLSSSELQPKSKAKMQTRSTCLIAAIPDVSAFYSIHHHFPFDRIQNGASVHYLRSGLSPDDLMVKEEDSKCGCVAFRIERGDEGSSGEHAKAVFLRMCLLVLGGEIQAALAAAAEREQREQDHVLGLSWVRGSSEHDLRVLFWLRRKGDAKSVQLLRDKVLEELTEKYRHCVAAL